MVALRPVQVYEMISQARPSLYRALDKGPAGFTSSSDEDFIMEGQML